MAVLTLRLVAGESPDVVLLERQKEVANLPTTRSLAVAWVESTIIGRELQCSIGKTAVTFSGPSSYVSADDTRRQIGIVFDRFLAQA